MVHGGVWCVVSPLTVPTLVLFSVLTLSPTHAYIYAVRDGGGLVSHSTGKYSNVFICVFVVTAALQQYDLHAVWRPTSLVWKSSPQGRPHGKMGTLVKVSKRVTSCDKFILCVTGSSGGVTSTQRLHTDRPTSSTAAVVWSEHHQIHRSHQTLRLQLWYKGQ